MEQKKIFNDPIYGFIRIHSDLIYKIIETPYFQRLRRIKQIGLSELVYPGASHSRFHHALGAMHLMSQALENLREKGHFISDIEYESALIAILLHDIGHTPFSHTLEHTLLSNVSHESVSLLAIELLNKQFNNKLLVAIKIFKGTYEREFFHQLVSSQMDIDRLDYLKRDSFFTGVLVGSSVGSERIIKLFNIVDDKIVIEEKGIYSVEQFLSARRLMYWQVYLHKTCIAAEQMLKTILLRVKYLIKNNKPVQVLSPLELFLNEQISLASISQNNKILTQFIELDDYDIWASIKIWINSDDKILSNLSKSLMNRTLNKIKLSDSPFTTLKSRFEQKFINAGVLKEELPYYLNEGIVSNEAYMLKDQRIQVLKKNGSVVDIEKIADLPYIKAMSKTITKYYLCWSNEINLPNKL